MDRPLPPAYWNEERYAVARAYPGKKWMDKVGRMPKEQVHEIFLSLKKREKRAGKEMATDAENVTKNVQKCKS
jgi:hypothetical protein